MLGLGVSMRTGLRFALNRSPEYARNRLPIQASCQRAPCESLNPNNSRASGVVLLPEALPHFDSVGLTLRRGTGTLDFRFSFENPTDRAGESAMKKLEYNVVPLAIVLIALGC